MEDLLATIYFLDKQLTIAQQARDFWQKKCREMQGDMTKMVLIIDKLERELRQLSPSIECDVLEV